VARTEVTLVVPGLAPILAQEINAGILPQQLQKVINKAGFTQHTENLSRLLTRLFSSDGLPDADLPLATLRDQHSVVLCADPCYLHADRDQLLLFADELAISDDDAAQIINLIQPLLADYDATLVQHSNNQWLLKLNTMPDLTFTALADVAGKTVQTALPKGDEQQRQQWIRLWNEIQMILFDSPVNIERQQQGRVPINSLWFWGKGDLSLRRNYWHSASGKHELLQQLANRSEIAYSETVQPSALFGQSGRHLLVFETLSLEGDWLGQLTELATILEQYCQLLKWKKIDHLTLEVPEHGRFELTPLRYWRPW